MYLLSVIIPIYNAEPWLDECLSSLLTSVAGSGSCVEYILVNDGSTDNSGLICDRYAAAYSNFHVIHQPNGGVSSARNTGISAATGTYFAWIDPDDYVAPEWFPEIRAAIQKDAPDIILMDSMRFGLGADQPEIYGRPGGVVDFDTFYTDILRDIRIRSGLPNKVMKAKLFRDISFDPELSILEDFAAMPRILQSVRSIYYIPKCLYHYRQHESSLLHHDSAELAFRSVEIAVRRMENTEIKYRRAAVIAAVWQAFSFLRTDSLSEKTPDSDSRCRLCRRFIRKNLLTVLLDEELSPTVKGKILLSTMQLYPFLLKLFSKFR